MWDLWVDKKNLYMDKTSLIVRECEANCCWKDLWVWQWPTGRHGWLPPGAVARGWEDHPFENLQIKAIHGMHLKNLRSRHMEWRLFNHGSTGLCSTCLKYESLSVWKLFCLRNTLQTIDFSPWKSIPGSKRCCLQIQLHSRRLAKQLVCVWIWPPRQLQQVDIDIRADFGDFWCFSGKIEVAAVRGEKIPTGWAVNGEGRNTNDPRC